MLLKLMGKFSVGRCLLPSAGGPNAKLASLVLNALAQEHRISVTGLHVVPMDVTDQQREEGRLRVEETLELLDRSVVSQAMIVDAETIAGGIAKASREFDMLVIGAAKEPWFRKVLFGEIPEKVARFSPTSVMVVKKYEGPVKSTLKKIMG
jgi:nucleotide-binding universal stress UspA family protein